MNINLFFDEIENSLCPIEQVQIVEEIINNIEEINKKNKICQLFTATHSPYILKKFLNRDDTIIINVESGKNINCDRNKELIFNNTATNNIASYDEISYLYYGIITSGYYISLYETMLQKFDDLCEKIKDFIIPLVEKFKQYKQINEHSNQDQNELISCYLALLVDEKYTDWDNFAKQFDDST